MEIVAAEAVDGGAGVWGSSWRHQAVKMLTPLALWPELGQLHAF